MKIDWWTLGFQVVNVLVLVWLLERFFWRPLSTMIEQRRAATQHDLDAATQKQTQANAALADIEHIRAGFAAERDAILAKAREAAEQAQAASLGDTEAQIEAIKTKAAAVSDQANHDVEAAWTERASQLAIDIATHLAGRLDGPAVNAAFLGWLVSAIGALSDTERNGAMVDGAPLEAFSAKLLQPADQARARALIGAAFAAHPEITFKVDPALIAGLELHGRDFIVSNSWRADLKSVLASLPHAA